MVGPTSSSESRKRFGTSARLETSAALRPVLGVAPPSCWPLLSSTCCTPTELAVTFLKTRRCSDSTVASPTAVMVAGCGASVRSETEPK